MAQTVKPSFNSIPPDTLVQVAGFLSLQDGGALSAASTFCSQAVRTARFRDLRAFAPDTYMGRIVSLNPQLRASKEEGQIQLLIQKIGQAAAAYVQKRGQNALIDPTLRSLSEASSQLSCRRLNQIATEISDILLSGNALEIFHGTSLTLNAGDSASQKAAAVREWIATHSEEITRVILEKAASQGAAEVIQAILDSGREWSELELFYCVMMSNSPEITQIILESRHAISPQRLGDAWFFAMRYCPNVADAIKRSGRPFNKSLAHRISAFLLPVGNVVIHVMYIPGYVVYGAQETYFAARRVLEKCRRH